MTETAMATKPPRSVNTNVDPFVEQKMLLALFGAFVLLPAGAIGFMVGFMVFGSALLGYVSAFSSMMFVGGILGFFTVIIRQAIQQVQIKVVQEK